MDLFLHNYFLKTSEKFFKSISIPLGLFYSKNVFFFYITSFLKANGKAHRVSSLPQLVPEALPGSLAWSLPLHPYLHYPVSVIRIVPNPVPLGPRWPIHPQTHRHFEKDRGTASHVPRSTEAGILDWGWVKIPASLGWGGKRGWRGVCWNTALWGHRGVPWEWLVQDQRSGKGQAICPWHQWLLMSLPSRAFASESDTRSKAHIRSVFVGHGSVITCLVGFPRWSIKRPGSGFPTYSGLWICNLTEAVLLKLLTPPGLCEAQDERNCITKGGKKVLLRINEFTFAQKF